MSNLKSNALPENIRKWMAPETRKELHAPTMDESQAKLDTKREKELQENVAALLRQRNIWFERKRMDKRTTGTVGCPDFLFAINGRAVAFECKLPGRLTTPEQDACHEAMRANNWYVYTVCTEQDAVILLNAVESAHPKGT